MARKKTGPKLPRITQLKSGAFNCQIMYNGKRLSITERDYADCVSRVMDIMAKRAATHGSPQHQNRKTQELTLRQAIDIYIESRTNVLSPSTIRGYRSMQEHRFQNAIDMRIGDTLGLWQMFINDESKNASAKTVKNAWGLIRRVLAINKFEVPEVNLPQVVSNEHEFLQPEEVLTFIGAIKDTQFEFVFLLGLHGLRCSEIFALDVEKNIDNNFIRVRGAVVRGTGKNGNKTEYVKKDTNKNGASRRDVPVLIPRLTELVKKAKKKTNDLQNTLIPPHPDVARKHLRRICKENDIPYVGLHGLRHSFASLCHHLKISEKETMRMGGWSDPTVMHRIYTHIANADKTASTDKLKNFFTKSA